MPHQDKPPQGWNFDNTYARLPEQFYARQNPVPVKDPRIAVFNHALSESLGLNGEALESKEGAAIFAGNEIPEGAEPIAQAYAGHQFGHLNMLGDGRAVLLGEHLTKNMERFDIQLKGSGPTPFSRRGDGRAGLGPMLREYIISEAMARLGIPTTRSLAVVTTGEAVFREKPQPGAILTRVAASHIRVGTFEFAAEVEEKESVRLLADYTIARHYPELVKLSEPYLALLRAVIERQATLIAKWMHAGFIHGVMNTDNMAISGETIDYGPCAFMDHYSHETLFSSIDRNGRYAFGNQPRIAQWNLTRFAETLLPLLHADQGQAVAKAKEEVGKFGAIFHDLWLGGMRAKLGFATREESDLDLIEELLKWMEKNRADYTNTFRSLSMDSFSGHDFLKDQDFAAWLARWQSRSPDKGLMRSVNPVVIPRNHRVEEALSAAVERDDYSLMDRLLAALESPFEERAENLQYRAPPALGAADSYQTFCGT